LRPSAGRSLGLFAVVVARALLHEDPPRFGLRLDLDRLEMALIDVELGSDIEEEAIDPGKREFELRAFG